MKIIYEFDPIEDRDDLRIVEIRHDMYWALCDLRDLSRSIYKGWEVFDEDKVVDKLNEIIIESKMDEIS